MATVYLGRHHTLNRSVAIKVLHPHLSSSTRNRKRFAREARAIEHLRHDNILEIYDYSGLDASDCYIITEFVNGRTVSDVIHERGRLPSEITAIVGLHLARALTYAHQEGILHRDLKPDNVMVRADGTVKLMDFGIARFLDESQVTMTGALVGSPAFMSPEQAKESTLDQRSDLFSLGTMLYYMVAGHLPFSGSNPSLILKNVIEGNRPNVGELAPTMSATLADAIERLMASNPSDRYNSAQEVAGVLERVLHEASIDPEDPSFSLKAYLHDSAAYTARLDAHLSHALVDRGKELLEHGDHLAALRLFNRLLSMDEHNEEVLQLVQSLHGEPASPRRQGAALALLCVALLVLGGVLSVVLQARHSSAAQDHVSAAALESMERQGGRAELAHPDPVPSEPVPTASPGHLPHEQEPGTAGSLDEPVPPSSPDRAVSDAHPADEAAHRAAERPAARPPAPRPARGRVTKVEAQPRMREPVVAENGQLRLTTGPYTASIYLDGEPIGTTRDVNPVELPPGSYELELRSHLILPKRIKVYVSAGEMNEVPVTLHPAPRSIQFDATYSDGCEVHLDGQRAGTLGELRRQLVITQPSVPHTVRVSCEGAGWKEVQYPFLHVDTRFPQSDSSR